MKRIERELEDILKVVKEWETFKVEYKRAFIRSDGLPMLYLKARSNKYYVHIEGIIKGEELKCYIKLTENDKTKHGHKDEIIGWDNFISVNLKTVQNQTWRSKYASTHNFQSQIITFSHFFSYPADK